MDQQRTKFNRVEAQTILFPDINRTTKSTFGRQKFSMPADSYSNRTPGGMDRTGANFADDQIAEEAMEIEQYAAMGKATKMRIEASK